MIPAVDEANSPFVRRCAALILPVDFDEAAVQHWTAGPAPFSNGSLIADADARATYFDDRVRRALYPVDSTRRWHKFATERGEAAFRGFDVEAVELAHVRFAKGRVDAFLIVHGLLPTERPLETLALLSRLPPLGGSDVRDWYESVTDGAALADPETKRATTWSFFTPAGELRSAFPRDGYQDWPPDMQWLWLLAAATPFETYPPDPAHRDELARSIRQLSRDWSVLMLRDGAAFLGHRPDRGQEDVYFSHAEVYFRSIYLDALLLGMMQRAALQAIADDVAELGDPIREPKEVRRIERRLTEFRNVYWWRHLSGHGTVNELTRAYGRQHHLDELSRQIVEEVTEYSRQAQTAAADRTNALLGFLTLVGLPLGLVIGVFQTLGIDSPLPLAIAAVSMVLLTIALLGAAAPTLLEPMLRAIRRRESRSS